MRMTIEEAWRFHQLEQVRVTSEMAADRIRCDGCGRYFAVGEEVLHGDNDDWYCDEACLVAKYGYIA